MATQMNQKIVSTREATKLFFSVHRRSSEKPRPHMGRTLPQNRAGARVTTLEGCR